MGESFSVKPRPLYACYRTWVEGAGELAISETLFGKRLKDRGVSKEHRRSGAVYVANAMGMTGGDSGEEV